MALAVRRSLHGRQGVETLCINELFGPIAANDHKRKRDRTKERRDLKAEQARRLARSPERTCELCGITFKKVQKDKAPPRFCSKSCSGRSGMAAIHAAMPLIAPKPAIYTVYRPLCHRCGIRFDALTGVSRLCSAECKRLDGLAKTRAKSAANDNKPPVKCRECGVTFTRQYGDVRKGFCSKTCSTRTHKRVSRRVERARLRRVTVENVDPTKVFDRDGWKCQLCGRKTPRKLRGSIAPNAPELDHIMPLSLGGEHSYANTHCSCRACNGAKGATPKGQMRLFG